MKVKEKFYLKNSIQAFKSLVFIIFYLLIFLLTTAMAKNGFIEDKVSYNNPSKTEETKGNEVRRILNDEDTPSSFKSIKSKFNYNDYENLNLIKLKAESYSDKSILRLNLGSISESLVASKSLIKTSHVCFWLKSNIYVKEYSNNGAKTDEVKLTDTNSSDSSFYWNVIFSSLSDKNTILSSTYSSTEQLNSKLNMNIEDCISSSCIKLGITSEPALVYTNQYLPDTTSSSFTFNKINYNLNPSPSENKYKYICINLISSSEKYTIVSDNSQSKDASFINKIIDIDYFSLLRFNYPASQVVSKDSNEQSSVNYLNISDFKVFFNLNNCKISNINIFVNISPLDYRALLQINYSDFPYLALKDTYTSFDINNKNHNYNYKNAISISDLLSNENIDKNFIGYQQINNKVNYLIEANKVEYFTSNLVTINKTELFNLDANVCSFLFKMNICRFKFKSNSSYTLNNIASEISEENNNNNYSSSVYSEINSDFFWKFINKNKDSSENSNYDDTRKRYLTFYLSNGNFNTNYPLNNYVNSNTSAYTVENKYKPYQQYTVDKNFPITEKFEYNENNYQDLYEYFNNEIDLASFKYIIIEDTMMNYYDSNNNLIENKEKIPFKTIILPNFFHNFPTKNYLNYNNHKFFSTNKNDKETLVITEDYKLLEKRSLVFSFSINDITIRKLAEFADLYLNVDNSKKNDINIINFILNKYARLMYFRIYLVTVNTGELILEIKNNKKDIISQETIISGVINKIANTNIPNYSSNLNIRFYFIFSNGSIKIVKKNSYINGINDTNIEHANNYYNEFNKIFLKNNEKLDSFEIEEALYVSDISLIDISNDQIEEYIDNRYKYNYLANDLSEIFDINDLINSNYIKPNSSPSIPVNIDSNINQLNTIKNAKYANDSAENNKLLNSILSNSNNFKLNYSFVEAIKMPLYSELNIITKSLYSNNYNNYDEKELTKLNYIFSQGYPKFAIEKMSDNNEENEATEVYENNVIDIKISIKLSGLFIYNTYPNKFSISVTINRITQVFDKVEILRGNIAYVKYSSLDLEKTYFSENVTSYFTITSDDNTFSDISFSFDIKNYIQNRLEKNSRNYLSINNPDKNIVLNTHLNQLMSFDSSIYKPNLFINYYTSRFNFDIVMNDYMSIHSLYEGDFNIYALRKANYSGFDLRPNIYYFDSTCLKNNYFYYYQYNVDSSVFYSQINYSYFSETSLLPAFTDYGLSFSVGQKSNDGTMNFASAKSFFSNGKNQLVSDTADSFLIDTNIINKENNSFLLYLKQDDFTYIQNPESLNIELKLINTMVIHDNKQIFNDQYDILRYTVPVKDLKTDIYFNYAFSLNDDKIITMNKIEYKGFLKNYSIYKITISNIVENENYFVRLTRLDNGNGISKNKLYILIERMDLYTIYNPINKKTHVFTNSLLYPTILREIRHNFGYNQINYFFQTEHSKKLLYHNIITYKDNDKEISNESLKITKKELAIFGPYYDSNTTISLVKTNLQQTLISSDSDDPMTTEDSVNFYNKYLKAVRILAMFTNTRKIIFPYKLNQVNENFNKSSIFPSILNLDYSLLETYFYIVLSLPDIIELNSSNIKIIGYYSENFKEIGKTNANAIVINPIFYDYQETFVDLTDDDKSFLVFDNNIIYDSYEIQYIPSNDAYAKTTILTLTQEKLNFSSDSNAIKTNPIDSSLNRILDLKDVDLNQVTLKIDYPISKAFRPIELSKYQEKYLKCVVNVADNNGNEVM